MEFPCLSKQALGERNRKIKQARNATKARRLTQVCRAFTCKIDYNKLKDGQKRALNELFRDAKRLYNDCVLADNVFDYEPPKDNIVMVRMPDKTFQPRTLSRIGSQQKQGVLQQAKDNVRALHALKEKGHKVGALKPVSHYDCIPLKQAGKTYTLKGNYIHVERIPGPMHLTGVRQLEGWEVGPAKLLRRASGYYIAFSCFKDKEEYERSKPVKPKPVIRIGGMDAGVETELSESDGTKTTRRYPDTPKSKYWARRRSKREYGSKGYWEANRQYRKEQERLKERRKHAAIHECQRLEAKYETLVIQDEQIASWMKRKGYYKYGRILHGGILGRLYAMLKKLPQVIVLDKWQPTTAWCRYCGRRTPTPVSQRIFQCAYCGIREERDTHAALNMTVLKDRPITYRELRKPRDIPIGPYMKAI